MTTDTTLKNLVLNQIATAYLSSREYSKYLKGYGDYMSTRHYEIVSSLDTLQPELLLSVYRRVMSGSEVIVCNVSSEGYYADVLVDGVYGGMDSEGTIHT